MRIEQLTFTRFIAAMAIVLFHFGKPLNVFSQPLLHQLLIQANIGVSYFFLLSGFVMIIAYGRKQEVRPVSYMQNRFARIYPVYLLAIVLSLIYKSFFVAEKFTFGEVFLNVFALQSWIPAKAMSINFPGWSLSVEFLFYAVFPFAFNYFYRNFSLKQLFFPILLLWLISQIFFNWGINSGFQISDIPRETENFLFYFPLMHLNQFLLGNLAGIFFIKKLNNKSGNYDAIILSISLLIILALVFKPTFLSYHNGLLAILFVPFIIFTALNTGWITKFSNKKFAIYLGEISYGIYILQIPVFMMTKFCLLKLGIVGDFKIFILGIVSLLIVSAISYQYFETPLREKIKKLNK